MRNTRGGAREVIKAQINPETGKTEIKVKADSGEDFQKEYVGIVAMVIGQFRANGFTDDQIEKCLVQAICDGFNNAGDMDVLN